MNREPFAAWLVELQPSGEIPTGVLLPWPDARPEIEKVMERYAFRDLADFSAPLFHEDNRDF
jgi:glycine cleavage system H protein